MATLAKSSGTVDTGGTGSPRGLNSVSQSVGRMTSSVKGSPENGPAGVSHELRNLLTALNLYSGLLAEPGVLTHSHRHMAEEIKLIAQAGKSLLDTLNRLPKSAAPQGDAPSLTASQNPDGPVCRTDGYATSGIVFEHQLAVVLDSCLPLLANLAGPRVHVHLRCAKNHGCLPLNSEDLTLILVNLVRNAAEAMPTGGGIWIAIQPAVQAGNGTAKCARIVVEDDGPGIPVKARAHLFESGFTTKKSSLQNDQVVMRERHGLGLAIVRRQVESAGGVIQAGLTSARGGARFEIRIPFPTIKGATKVADERDNELQRTNHTDEGTRVRC
jgi:signal transduction histidine kinase